MSNNVAEGVGILVLLVLSAGIALGAALSIKGSAASYYVGNRSMSTWLVGFTLTAQFLTVGTIFGNFALTVMYGFWLGFALPLGEAVALLIAGTFLAKPLQDMKLATLSDFYIRRFSKTVEFAASLVLSFGILALFASDAAGIAYLFEFAFSLKYEVSVTISIIYITLYTMFGGLVSVAWTDVLQTVLSVVAVICAFISTCVQYPRELEEGLDQMFSMRQVGFVADGALIFWATMVALGIGSLGGSDLMERIFAGKSAKAARNGLYFAAFVSTIVGLFVTIMACTATQFIDNFDDPDFNPDIALLSYIRYRLPRGLSVLMFMAITSMAISTGDGAVLAATTMLTRNLIIRHFPKCINNTRLSVLWITRLMTIPCGLIGLILALVIPSPGLLLVLAFDLILAGCVAPLFFGIWWQKMSSAAAMSSIIIGSGLRLILHFTTPTHLKGSETLIPPLISIFVCIVVSMIKPHENLGVLQGMRNVSDDLEDSEIEMSSAEVGVVDDRDSGNDSQGIN